MGLAVSRKVVKTGGNVLLTARNPEAGWAAAKQLCRERIDSALSWELDVANEASINDLVAKVELNYDQKINVLVNNAGIYPREWSKEVFDRAISTNYKGPLLLTEKLLPYLAPGATIVMVSSEAGCLSHLSHTYRSTITAASDLDELEKDVEFIQDDPQQKFEAPAYCVSKAMLNRATQLLATTEDLVDRGISINAVCPGWCRTDMGGEVAPRSVEDGRDSIFWVMEHARPRVTGGFYRDGKPLPW